MQFWKPPSSARQQYLGVMGTSGVTVHKLRPSQRSWTARRLLGNTQSTAATLRCSVQAGRLELGQGRPLEMQVNTQPSASAPWLFRSIPLGLHHLLTQIQVLPEIFASKDFLDYVRWILLISLASLPPPTFSSLYSGKKCNSAQV